MESKRWGLVLFGIVFFLALPAGAVNRVEVKVTSQPIAQGPYAVAGGIYMEFDPSTEIAAGDQLFFDLDLGVVLAQDYDLEISLYGGGWTRDAILGNTRFIGYQDRDGILDEKDCRVENGGVFFRLSGVKGESRLRLDVMGTGSVTVGDEIGDLLWLKILNGETHLGFAHKGIWIDADGDGIYGEPGEDALSTHNRLTIDTYQFDENAVKLNLDSADDQFTFIPSNPQIAHIVSHFVPGDFNGDGRIDLKEAIHALKVVAGHKN